MSKLSISLYKMESKNKETGQRHNRPTQAFYNVYMFQKLESHTVAGSRRQPTRLNMSLQPKK
jgi:hypothetical protein